MIRFYHNGIAVVCKLNEVPGALVLLYQYPAVILICTDDVEGAGLSIFVKTSEVMTIVEGVVETALALPSWIISEPLAEREKMVGFRVELDIVRSRLVEASCIVCAE